jgi:catechol 2,3-dioxygenase-like lactoylglutathione lyase family enzyme
MEVAMDNGEPGAGAAVHSVDHFALNVPSIPDARKFFTAFGLAVSEVTKDCGTELELRALDGHRWARIFPASKKSLSYLSFSCFAGDIGKIERQVREAGGRFSVDVSAVTNGRHHTADGLWFEDPDGNLIHVNAGPKVTASRKESFGRVDVAADRRGSHSRSQARIVRPRRMSHVVLFTPDTLRAVDFYERSIGLRLSDRSMDRVAFMHAIHGCDHHLVAFVKSRGKGWHHVAWDVEGIDDVGEGAAQMAAAGYRRGWGTGRHVLGSNYFHYVMDPWGSFCEYSADIDYVTAGVAWSSGDFPPEDSLHLWGPDVPDYFTKNTEL